MSHTPEPWQVHKPRREIRQIGGGDSGIEILSPCEGGGGFMIVVGHVNCQHDMRILSEADADRIVACVNACAGLNPAMIADAIGALTWLLDDIADAGEDKNPETGDVYDSVANARKALAAVKEVPVE